MITLGARARETVRATFLRWTNTRRLERYLNASSNDQIPNFIVVTPHLVHLAPLALRNSSSKIGPVLLANGLNDDDLSWLGTHCDSTPIVRLQASLLNREGTMLEHGVVLNSLVDLGIPEFCIQDADCFVTSHDFWGALKLDSARHYAAGPFVRAARDGKPSFPETFLLLLNGRLLEQLNQRFDLDAATTSRPSSRAQARLTSAGYPPGRFVETLKDYYDTMQQYWVVAMSEGFAFNRIAGEGENVFHIGGTSYLYRDFSDLEHWDYWALSVQYLHLRLLEMPACRQLRARFAPMFDFHRSALDLLRNFPTFSGGWRRSQADSLIDLMVPPSYRR